jgi:glycosyltransferase involved in cell wall biosynthesis
MRGSEYESTVLFTGISPAKHEELDSLGVSYTSLGLPMKRRRADEWRALKQFLESHAPCIYIPNFDFHRSCAIGTLNPGVRVCMVIHSDEECYYDELRRVGADCDSIVCVSTSLRDKVTSRFPALANRVIHIPYGVATPSEVAARDDASEVLRVAYCNRLQQYQKRVFDLPAILEGLRQLRVPFHLTVAGDGPDAEALHRRLEAYKDGGKLSFRGRVANTEVMKIFRDSHAFLLTSDFEGLPISLLEAMSVGCVPVVYQIDSGINDAISHGETGFVVPHGDTGAFAAALARLQRDPATAARVSNAAVARVRERFSLARMCVDYESLFARLLAKSSDIARPRRSGVIRVPHDLTFGFRAKRRLASMFGR